MTVVARIVVRRHFDFLLPGLQFVTLTVLLQQRAQLPQSIDRVGQLW